MKLIALSFILYTLFFCPALHAQSRPAADPVEVELAQFTNELLANFASLTAKKDAAVTQLTSTAKQAEKDYEQLVMTRQKVALAYETAAKNAELRKAFILKNATAMSPDSEVYKDYQQSVQKTATIKAKLEELQADELKAKMKLTSVQADLEKARKDREGWSIVAQRYFAGLNEQKSAYEATGVTDRQEKFKALTGHLTLMAAFFGEASDVTLVTKKSAALNPGAIIKYESELDRKNGVTPIKSTNCATGCVEKGMPKGWFYMWSERDQKETSDKSRYVHIKGPEDSVDIIENP